MNVGVVCVGVHTLRHLKGKLAWAIEQWLKVMIISWKNTISVYKKGAAK